MNTTIAKKVKKLQTVYDAALDKAHPIITKVSQCHDIYVMGRVITRHLFTITLYHQQIYL